MALLVLEELPAVIRFVATPILGGGAVHVAEYWQIVLGPMFLLVVLYAHLGGISGLLEGLRVAEGAGHQRTDQTLRRRGPLRRGDAPQFCTP